MANITTGFKYDPYKESDSVKQAKDNLNQHMGNKPGPYTSTWQSQINDTVDKILNREGFSYDFNADALYQQYKNQYTTQGQMAMMDTIGQAAAMTGGYGNSYAQSVGQQAYQGYLQQLNDKIPELYQLALNKYQMEGDQLYNQYGILSDQENQDYNRYRDSENDWRSDRDYYQNQYNTERDYDYGMWADNRDFSYGQHIDDRNYNYQVGRDQVADQQWQAEFDENKRRYDQEWNEAHPAGGSSSWTPPAAQPDTDPDAEEPTNPSGMMFIEKQLNQSIAGGAQKGEVSDLIRRAYNDGYITKDEADQLRNTYVPHGYIYR